MDWTHIRTEWDEVGRYLQERWGRLSDEDLVVARAGRNELIGCIEKRYKIERGLAERHVDGWMNSLG